MRLDGKQVQGLWDNQCGVPRTGERTYIPNFHVTHGPWYVLLIGEDQ